jgi:hypothetical protein
MKYMITLTCFVYAKYALFEETKQQKDTSARNDMFPLW